MMTGKETLIWMAGIFEGEGSVFIRTTSSKRSKTGRTYYSLAVEMGSTEKELVEPFVSRFGGSIQIRRLYTGRTFYDWRAVGTCAERFLSEVRPYLRSVRKHKLAELGLEFRSKTARIGQTGPKRLPKEYYDGQKSYRTKMQTLNLGPRAKGERNVE